MLPHILLVAVSFVFRVNAIPTTVLKSRSVSVLSTSSVNAFTPFAQFARAAYCNPASTASWSCGQACSANTGFVPSISGGDGNGVQFWYVGYWPTQNTVVVAHQGTDPTQLESDLTDLNIAMTSLSSSLFPGVPGGALVHAGFAAEHGRTASTILSTVKQIISQRGATKVTLVGHSLGGALALLDTVMMRQNLPSSISVQFVAFGLPRVGNPAFASFVDSLPSTSITHINNVQDLIPIVPGRFLGFAHPKGEIHITSDSTISNTWVSCSGDDDATDGLCTIASVPNILFGNILDHLGPYNGVFIGTLFCT